MKNKIFKKINKNAIVSVEIIDKELYKNNLQWAEYRNIWWIKNILKERTGFQSIIGGHYRVYTAEELRQGKFKDIKFIVKDKKVYLRPYVKIELVNGQNEIKEFKTIEECNTFVNYLLKKFSIDFIEIN